MSDSATTDRELSPPDQTFWKRYSSRHECPIAASASTLVHLLAIGGVVLAGLAMSWRWYGDKTQPPEMGLVYLEGSPGDGRPIGGGGGGPKEGGVENIASSPQPLRPTVSSLPKSPAPILVPMSPPTVDDNTDVGVLPKSPPVDDKALAKLEADLARSVAASSTQASGNGGTGRGGTGTGGGLGTGEGTGTGSGKGPGDGTGPAMGTTKALRAQILANRWRFDSGGSPRERIAKLASFGMKLGFADFAGNLFMIEDLQRRPFKFRPDSFERYKETVKFGIGQDCQDWAGLVRELGFPVIAEKIVLLVPPDREQKMADEEMRYAREKGYDFSKVEATLFDFEPVRGVYEPVVKGQAPFDRNVPIGKTRR
jgi:hypothetical protein